MKRRWRKRLAFALATLLALALLVGCALWFRGAHLFAGARPAIEADVERYRAEGVRPSNLPPRWIDTLLAVEDPAFREHSGVDLSTPGAGWTTITQGLAKHYCFDDFRPGGRAKLDQILCSLHLDRAVSKDDQLLLLLNGAGLGPRRDGEGWVEGFPAAAGEHFGERLSELSDREFLTLVAMLVGPRRFHPTLGAEALDERVHRIERLLAGECQPTGWRDVYYEACRSETASQPE